MGEGSSDSDDPEYQRVFATLDELDFGSLKPVFKEKHFRDKTLSFIKSEEELKEILKEELKLPFGQRFEFSCLWFQKYHGIGAVQGKKKAVGDNNATKLRLDEKETKAPTKVVDVNDKVKGQKIISGVATVECKTEDSTKDDTSAYDEREVPELLSPKDNKELLVGHDGPQPRMANEEDRVKTVDRSSSTWKEERKQEDVKEEGEINTVSLTVEHSIQGSNPSAMSTGENVNEEDLVMVADNSDNQENRTSVGEENKEISQNERDVHNRLREEEECHQSSESKGKKEKMKTVSKRTESGQSGTNSEDAKTKQSLSEGQTSNPLDLTAETSEVTSVETNSTEETSLTVNVTPKGNNPSVVIDQCARKSTSADVNDREITTDDKGAISIHNEDPFAVADKGDSQKDERRGSDTILRQDDIKPTSQESTSQSKGKKKKKKKKRASQETGSAQITQSVDKDEEDKTEDDNLPEGQLTSVIPDLPPTLANVATSAKDKLVPAETHDHDAKNKGSIVSTEHHDKDSDYSLFGVTKRTSGKDTRSSERAEKVLPSETTAWRGVSNTEHHEKSNEWSISGITMRTTGKVEETASSENAQNVLSLQTTVSTCSSLKKPASSTVEQKNSTKGMYEKKIVNHEREPGDLAGRAGDQENDYRKVSICDPRPRGVTGKEFFYHKGCVLDVEENREIEFKSLVNAHPNSLPWKIMEKAKKFICACLNNDRKGIIYFGVGDSQEQGSRYKHGEILGLQVNDIKDDINKAFQFLLDDHIKSDAGPLQKGGEQNCITLHFVPVKVQGTRSKLYVIEIEVTRDWRFCKDHVYYSKTWAEKRDKDCAGKKALADFFKVKDEFDDVAIRTNGASSCVKHLEVDRQVKKPLEVKYKEWRKKEKHDASGASEEHNVEDADAKRFSIVLRERLRELNYKENGYILVANKLPAQYRGTAHLSFLQNIPWVAVFDLFDPASKQEGLHYACNETTDALRAIIRTLDDFKEITPDKDAPLSTRGTTWILSTEEMQKGDWIKGSKDCLYRALSAYKECFPPGRLVCVFLCLGENSVDEMADIMESTFSIFGTSASSCVTIVSETTTVAEAFIRASKRSLQRELRECSLTGIPWGLLKEIVREIVGPSKFEERGATTELPYFTGQYKQVLNKTVNSWNDLEVYRPNPRLPRFAAEAIETERDAFYKGAQASQINLFQDHTIPRSLEQEVMSKVEKTLKSLSKENIDANYHVKTVIVPYEPGSGATTLCRRILWNKRTEYRSAVVKAITSVTDFQIDNLQRIAYDENNLNYSLPVLVLVDNFPESDVRLLTDHIMKRRTKCVVLTTMPISKSATNTKFEITPLRKLDEKETSLVKNILINIMSDSERRREAEEALEREKRFIWFGLELFGRDYFKIEERLQNHIHSILTAFLGDSQRMHKSVLEMCCFLNKYSDGCIILPHAVVLDCLYDTSLTGAVKQSSAIQEVHEVFGGLLLEEQNETNGYYGWRPAHSLVSDVVTSRISIEETAIRSLEQALDDGVVGTDLDNDVFGFYGKRTRYSPVIVNILDKDENVEGALRVLLTVCEKATEIEDKAFAWQQLARFMGYELCANEMDETNELHRRLHHAMTEEQPDKPPMPRTGIDAAHIAVDIAVSLQPSYTNHYTTKGVLYLLQLRDFKTLSLQSLPEAIEICRKALSVYHKALQTSREPNHFSMIGKIQANVSLLQIVKDLPCFHSEERKFTSYLKRRAVPLEMAEVLSPNDQDYLQSLGTTTLDLLNELFGHVKLKQTTTYDENEIRGLNNAKIRASNLRRKFYEITGFDKRELTSEEYSLHPSLSSKHELALYQQRVQDILFIRDETPYSAWSNLTDKEVSLIYQLLKSICLRGHGSHNDMLICCKACLQLKDKPPVEELDTIVSIWVQKFKDSEWAHLFYYMIHFPIPNGSLASYNPNARASIKKCGSIVREKAGSGFRKSGAEYFLGKGIGLNAILSSQEFRWLETKWKTKTDFWRGKEPSERLERVQGQKEVGSKGIISYQGVQLHFDNTLYPNESKDDLWFYVGFTVAGPYAYDPVDKDTYATLRKQQESIASLSTPRPSSERFDNSDRWSISSRHFGASKARVYKTLSGSPQENICANQSGHASVRPPPRLPRDDSHLDFPSPISSSSFTASADKRNARSGPSWDSLMSASLREETCQRKHPPAGERRVEAERAKWKSVTGTNGNNKGKFCPKSVDSDGKLHHGAFVLGLRKSKECEHHNSMTAIHVTSRCNFAHGWRGDTLQFVCTKCTNENLRFCKEKVNHEKYIWNLGPYLTRSGNIWKSLDGSRDSRLDDAYVDDFWGTGLDGGEKDEKSDESWGSRMDVRDEDFVESSGSRRYVEDENVNDSWDSTMDVKQDDDDDDDDEDEEDEEEDTSWKTVGHNRFSALSK